MIDVWRTTVVPYAIRARECATFHTFVKGVASDTFYTKFEALCDGVIDMETREGDRIEHYIRIRILRGKTFDLSWHRLQLASNGEVKLADTPREKELGITGWLKGR